MKLLIPFPLRAEVITRLEDLRRGVKHGEKREKQLLPWSGMRL